MNKKTTKKTVNKQPIKSEYVENGDIKTKEVQVSVQSEISLTPAWRAELANQVDGMLKSLKMMGVTQLRLHTADFCAGVVFGMLSQQMSKPAENMNVTKTITTNGQKYVDLVEALIALKK